MPYGEVDYAEVMRLAQEQAVVGLVAAGLEHVADVKIPHIWALQFAGQTIQIEQQNMAMNQFIADLVAKMQDAQIHTLLVKGQGVAQCYERPLWRCSGDVDLLLSENNYQKANVFLSPLASIKKPESTYGKHISMTIDSWVVELHGTQQTELSSRIDRVIDDVQRDIFFQGNVRYWQDGNTQVFLPSPNNDVILVFTHFLKHFYKGGVGLRQICDWTRLLWRYKETLNHSLLERILRNAGVMTEWKAFGAFAVEYLGMPAEAMPFYSSKAKWKRKARRIFDFLMDVGNFGHNRDMSYFSSKPYVVRKAISFGRRMRDLFRHARIFPVDSIRFLPRIIINGLRSAANGE